MANTWAQLKPDVLKVPGANHLMVVEGLANSESELHSTVVRMLALGLTQISRCLSRLWHFAMKITWGIRLS